MDVFLKTVLGGALLAAVGKGGNNQMYPICWAVVEAENQEIWTWFMELIFEELRIENGLGWTFISDQQKGLLNAMQNLTPFADVRNCARHVYCNWKKELKCQELKNIFWGAMRSTYESEYLTYLDYMKMLNEAAYHDFLERDLTKCCKSFVGTLPKSDIVDNNVCETFNGYIVKTRSKHIIEILEEIRTSLMARQHKKLGDMSGVTDKICPLIRKKLETNEYSGRLCIAKPAVGGKFQVTINDDQFIVDLSNWTYSCRIWDISGIPCMHACSCICFMKKETTDFVSQYYSVKRYIETYSYALQPINGRKMWPNVVGNPVKPPPFKKMPGRPKKLRKRAPEENPKNPYKLARHVMEMTCSNCGEKGHNMRSSKNPTQKPQVKRKRGRPRTTSAGNMQEQAEIQAVETTNNPRQNQAKRRGRPITRSHSRQASQEPSGMKKNNVERNNRPRELRQARKRYGAYCSESGQIYFKSPGSKKINYVSGTTATERATSRKSKLGSNAQPSSSGVGQSNAQPSHAGSTISSRSAPGMSTIGRGGIVIGTQESTAGK